MLHLHVSNRTEALTTELLVRLGAEQSGPFAAAQVIVPSTAVRRWLTLAMAQQHGVCANVHFDYLASWLWQQIGRPLLEVTPGAVPEPPLSAAVLAWHVYRAFGDAEFVAGHPRLVAYLQAADDVMRFELAQRSAALFEQYVTYRPDWLTAWVHGGRIKLRGVSATATTASSATAASTAPTPPAAADALADEAWQAALWRRMAAELGLALAHPGATFLQALQATTPKLLQQAGLPASAHVFALPTMPPLHMQLLQQLAQVIELHLYVLNPCREYWFEVVDRRRLAHLRVRAPRQALLQEEGNRLLASWGRQTQSHIDLLLDSSTAVEETDDFITAGGVDDGENHHGETSDSDHGRSDGDIDDDSDDDNNYNDDDDDNTRGRSRHTDSSTLLSRVQDAVLNLQELAPASVALSAIDRSIEVHVCHSLTRELEVLQDHLLGLFADSATIHDDSADVAHASPALRPCDVLVVLPDLEAAAPLIDAVFGTAPPERRLPYAISGRARSSVDAPARTLLDLLALCASRCVASDVFALLQQANVARRFGLDDDGLQQVHTWLREAGFRWGLDAAHRAQFGVPALARHTLADALARLLLGYASPTQTDESFQALLPAGDAQGSGASALGALARFAHALQRLQAATQGPHTATAWCTLLLQALDVFTLPQGDELDDHRALQACIRTLADTLQAGGMAAEPLPFAVLRAALAHSLDDPARGGVATGKITFSSMTSLRNIPFQVIAVLGLNDGAFPSANRPPEFDLMALHPRRGDRQRRHDERNLFLDLLLAARRSFYLSHTGRSVRDNAPLPPSVLISELLDVLVPTIADPHASNAAAALQAARRRLRVEHPLQPFSMAAFATHGDPRLRSFNAELADALRHSVAVHRVAPAEAAAAAVPSTALADDADSRIDTDAHTDIDIDPDDSADDAQHPAFIAPFFSTPLPAAGPEWHDFSLPQLIDFFRNPSRFVLRRRLGMHLPRDAEALIDEEPFLPDLPARSALAQRLLPTLLAGAEQAIEQQAIHALASAGIEMPGGALGQDHLQRELQALQRFADTVRAASSAPLLAPRPATLTFEVSGETWRLHSAFTDLRAAGLLRWRYDALRARDVLEAWLSHLALCAAAPAGVAPHTTWLALDGPLHLGPVADAHALLTDLMALVQQGLCAPLPFFAKTSWAYAGAGMGAAHKAWLGSREHGGESQDAAHRLAWRGREDTALGPAFEALALRVFGPLLDQQARQQTQQQPPQQPQQQTQQQAQQQPAPAPEARQQANQAAT